MAFELPPLPYEHNALEPHISEETLRYHHDKHHAAYVNNLNNLVKGTPLEQMSLEDIIKVSGGAVFNNAAQVWNHTFYFNCLAPAGGGAPDGALLGAINAKWGTLDNFKKAFAANSIGLFGSGWGWLVADGDGNLELIQTSNADTALLSGKTPLLTCDVWEHAYYIDARNDRAKYLDAFWQLVNWNFVSQQFAKATEST